MPQGSDFEFRQNSGDLPFARADQTVFLDFDFQFVAGTYLYLAARLLPVFDSVTVWESEVAGSSDVRRLTVPIQGANRFDVVFYVNCEGAPCRFALSNIAMRVSGPSIG